MDDRHDSGARWHRATQGSILGPMREVVQAPRGSHQVGIPDTRPRTDSETTEELRTFLIADVRGYTVFTQERGDEAAARLAAKFADIVREHVENRGGSMIELRADGALAVFRSPRQAVRAAVELQARFLEQTEAAPDLPLPVAVGLDAGEAEAVGGGYWAGALNLAGRLCSEAGPGEILATQSVVHLARTVEGVRYFDRGELHLRGLSEPVHVLAIASVGIDVVGQMRAFIPRQPARRVYRGKMQFRVLGPLEVDAGSGPIPLGGPKQRAVLAHLLMRANELVPTGVLIDEIWGEEPPEKARNIIQAYVSQLRKALGHDRIEWHAPGYRLRLDASDLDANRFDTLVRDAKRALTADPNLAVGTLEDALALWRGPALAGFADQPSLLAEATRLDDLRLEAQEDRIEALLAIGAQARAIGELEVLLAHHPHREGLWGQLMLAFYREGRQAEALGAYQRAKEILADELGIDPSPELARLHERILRQDPGLDLRGEGLRGYRLLEKISDGPRGVVFRAIQPRVERDVAVKVFHEGIAADPGFVRRFEQEAQAVATLEHPHIASIYDYWREPGRAYVVSRYLRGGSLRALEERGQSLELDRAVRVVEHVASALVFAHRQGVAHGSLRSSNVLFDGEGNAYLGDFLVGVGPVPDPLSDVRDLARLAQGLLGHGMPERLGALVDEAELGTAVPGAEAFAQAARAALVQTAIPGPRRPDTRNPYKGLRAFTEADARDFFGRGELTQRLVAGLGDAGLGSRFLAVVGPSGSGKSSVVRAGLVPAIRHGALGDPEGQFIAEMCPGPHPIDELETALLRIAVRPIPRLHDTLESGSRGLLQAVELLASHEAEVVLVVDQFEEVFTLCSDEREREQFLEALRVASVDPDSRLRVVVTLRADFYDRPLIYPRFGELLAATTEAVPPLTPDELEQAIRKPAEQVGVSPEPGLVAEMIAEVAHQPGALPLLQYALTELFERRDDDRLTLAAHQEVGGVAGALSARADRILDATDPQGRRAIKQVFLRLVTLGEGTQDTRRRVVRSELDGLEVKQEAIDGVLEAFGRHRFLTFDRNPSTREPTVEIAHEALLGAWRRLRTWIDETREDLRQEGRLTRAAAEWQGSDRDPSFLLRGTRLEQLEQWAASTDLAFGRPERAYLKASLDQRERERAEEEARRGRERRTERRSRTRLRALVAVFAVAALVAASLTVVAVNQSRRAEREARIAMARELAAAALANLEADPELSILLATEAVERTRSEDESVRSEAAEALHRAVVGSRTAMTVPGVRGALDWSSSGVFVTEGPEDSGLIDIRDASTGESVLSFKGHDVDVNDVAFSPDGAMLATAGDDGKLKVWDPSTGDLLSSVSGTGEVWGPSFSADGSLVAASWKRQGTVRVADPSTGRVVRALPGVPDPTRTAFSPDGSRIAVASFRGTVVVIDLETGEETLELLKPGWPIIDVSWSPDGRYIATAGFSGVGQVWDAKTGRLRFTLVGHTGVVQGVAWSPDSSRLVTGGGEGAAKVWEIGKRGARELLSLSAHETRAGIFGVAFSPDGTQVMAGANDVTKIWDVGPTGDAEWANLPGPHWAGEVEFMPDGRRVAASSAFGSVGIWDLETRRALRTIGPPGDPDVSGWLAEPSFDVSPDGAIAIAYSDGTVRAWDATGKELFTVTHPAGVFAVDWSPDGRLLLTADWYGSTRIFDRSGRNVSTLQEHRAAVTVDGTRLEVPPIFDAQFSPDGRLVATSPYSGGGAHIAIWDWQRGDVVRTIGTARYTSNVAFDPSGSRIATASGSGTEVRDVERGTRLAAMAAAGVLDVAFSPDGSRVATASNDTTVRLFEAESGGEILVLRGHCGAVSAVAFSPDGTRLASMSFCDGVRVWALNLDDLLQIAEREVKRSLTSEECLQYLHVNRCPPS
jgi:WD40 repeat protein/DNA-binding SARP family transcriptional activator/class 3 adenylate cyclase